jgi:hypothetical protein
MIRDVHPESGCWFLPIPDPESKGQKGNGSRIRNTATVTFVWFILIMWTYKIRPAGLCIKWIWTNLSYEERGKKRTRLCAIWRWPAREYHVRGTHRLNLGRSPRVGIFSIPTLDGKWSGNVLLLVKPTVRLDISRPKLPFACHTGVE